MEHFNIYDEIKTIDFFKVLEIIKESSFWQYYSPNLPSAELHIYFDDLKWDKRTIYTVYFNNKSLNISRCTGFNGEKWTKGGNGAHKVAKISNKGRKEFDKFMQDFSLNKYGYEFNPVTSSI